VLTGGWLLRGIGGDGFKKNTFIITKNLISGISFTVIVLFYNIKMLIDFWCKTVLRDFSEKKKDSIARLEEMQNRRSYK